MFRRLFTSAPSAKKPTFPVFSLVNFYVFPQPDGGFSRGRRVPDPRNHFPASQFIALADQLGDILARVAIPAENAALMLGAGVS
jgi:hypothetical protein